MPSSCAAASFSSSSSSLLSSSRRALHSLLVSARPAASASASASASPARAARRRHASSSSAAASASASVHASEIAHFTRLASQWWDPHGEFALLHAMNPVRIEFMRSKMEEVRLWDDALRAAAARRRVHTADSSSSSSSKGKQRAQEDEQETRPRASFLHDLDVLDVGCGGGFLSESLTRLGARTLGIDAASSNINIARAHAALDPALTSHPSRPSSLTYRDCTAEVLRHEGAQFDVVCAMEVVEHVRNPADFLRTLGALLKPGGHLFLSTIARTPVAHFLTIAMAEHILRLVSPGTHTYTQYIKPAEMLDFFKKSPANGGLGWLEQHQAASGNQTVPDRLRYEIRGTAYLPWKSAWQLADRNASPAWSQLANYFFWARKPFDP